MENFGFTSKKRYFNEVYEIRLQEIILRLYFRAQLFKTNDVVS